MIVFFTCLLALLLGIGLVYDLWLKVLLIKTFNKINKEEEN